MKLSIVRLLNISIFEIWLFKKSDRLDFDPSSNTHGILYKEYDRGGNWKDEIVKELKEIGYPVDRNKVKN